MAALITLSATLTVGAIAQDGGPQPGVAPGADYLTLQRWLTVAEDRANDAVTYEICGWGRLDLRTTLLAAAMADGVTATAWDQIAARYDQAADQRRRLEAVLTAHGHHPPAERVTGLHPTGGCPDALRRTIEGHVGHPTAVPDP